jgi:nitrite reductase (cytochrome c-552)
MPDINTKEKAQKFIGLDIPAERAAKAKFLKTVVPEWIKKAKAQGTLVMN